MKTAKKRYTSRKRELTEEEKLELARFVEKINNLVASEHQEVIFERARSGNGRYVVSAGPGSGKTTTAIKASTWFSGKAISFSFNKKIQVDTARKLKALGSQMTASTLHSFGRQCIDTFIKQHGGQLRVEEDKYDKIIQEQIEWKWEPFLISIRDYLDEEEEEVNVTALRFDAIAWSKTLVHYCQVALTEPTGKNLVQLVDQFDLNDIDPFSPVWPFVCDVVETALREGKRLFHEDYIINLDDMIYYPNIFPIPVPTYDHIILDEAQDASRAAQGLLYRACHRTTQVFAIGDPKQCQPAGTMVRLRSGEECPIERLNVGDQVVTFDRRSAAFVKSGVVTERAARQYDGPLYTIAAGGRETKCTDSHKWLVRWTNTEKPAWVTYLMKKGEKYRVGQAQLFNTAEGRAQFGLGIRARVEGAEAAWILQVHESFQSAIIHEAVVAARYGLPQVVFHPVWNNAHLTQEAIECIYDELHPLEERARQCLIDHGRRIEYPLYVRSRMSGYHDNRRGNSAGDQQRQGRTTFFETQACNLLSGYMAVPVVPEILGDVHEKLDWQVVTVTSQPYSGLVYSLNIEKHHKYIADGLVTCNSIYAFAGADHNSIPNLIKMLDAQVLPLRVCYRCGTKIIDLANQLNGQIIPAPNMHEGTVDIIARNAYLEKLRAGDAVIGRTTAKLVEDCLKVLQTGKLASVLGKKIGESIAAIVKRIEAKRVRRGVSALKKDLSNFVELVDEYQRLQEQTIKESKRKNRDLAISELKDKVDTVRAFYTAYITKCIDESERSELDPECEFNKTPSDFITYIMGLFTEDEAKNRIQFMTAHRSKGLEFKRVFIIGTNEFPHPKAKGEKQRQQEENLMYVAITRAIDELYFLEAPFDAVRLSKPEEEEPAATQVSGHIEKVLTVVTAQSVLQLPTEENHQHQELQLVEASSTLHQVEVQQPEETLMASHTEIGEAQIEVEEPKPKHAGGRPRKGRVRVNITLDTDLAELTTKIDRSELINTLLRKYFDKPDQS